MGRLANTFAGFVTLLSHALDDHEATGADLAARMRLSRFHLDRVISAVAGEPPGRLRRRVLLERAAYQLPTTRVTVLDVAVAAGYSSHEAFSRAFTRAYGVPPPIGGGAPPGSTWTRRTASTSNRRAACGSRPEPNRPARASLTLSGEPMLVSGVVRCCVPGG